VRVLFDVSFFSLNHHGRLAALNLLSCSDRFLRLHLCRESRLMESDLLTIVTTEVEEMNFATPLQHSARRYMAR